MYVGYFIHDVEDDSDGIGESAGDQQCQSRCADIAQKSLEEEDNVPAHAQIDDQRQPLQFAEYSFQQDADHGQSPDEAEDRPALRPFESQQREWGIGSGNQQVDADMVENLEQAFQ